MNYNIYTGYVEIFNQHILDTQYGSLDSQSFFKIWYENTRDYYPYADIFVFGPDSIDFAEKTNQLFQLATYDNLGHIGEYISGSRQGVWCGWTAGIVLGMSHAYATNKDFVYKEQDCLAFGKYIEKMYEEIGSVGLIYGKNKTQECSQSLFLAKRNDIPNIIAHLSKQSDKDLVPEIKFRRYPNSKFFSFGCDRDRPIVFNDPFYIQQMTKDELDLVNEYYIL